MTNDSSKIMDAGHHLCSDVVRYKFRMLIEAALRAPTFFSLSALIAARRRARPEGCIFIACILWEGSTVSETGVQAWLVSMGLQMNSRCMGSLCVRISPLSSGALVQR
jgi:hypothetical protein